jgi:hypothetical protein
MKLRLAGQTLAVVLVVDLAWMMWIWQYCNWVVLVMEEERGNHLGPRKGRVQLQRPEHGGRIQEGEID